MTFANSPKLDGSPSSPWKGLTRWIYDHQRGMLLFAGSILALLILILLGQYLAERPTYLDVGGLEGCLVAEGGDPVAGTVEILDVAKTTYSDGCFFFASLSPGEHELRVSSEDGVEWSQTVEIISGQAVDLGQILITP